MAGDLVLVVGARPNFMKIAPVYEALRTLDAGLSLRLVHTGQHYDTEMSDVFFGDLSLPTPDAFLGVGGGSHGAQTARALEALEAFFVDAAPALVVVPGDVNSTLAAALAAVKLQIPVAHVEAGLRSFDPSMPEEHNRRLTDHVSSLLLAHSQGAVENLAREAISGEAVHLVGNTMIDSLLACLPLARTRDTLARFGVEPGQYGLVTLHRPSLVDEPELLGRAATALVDVASAHPLVFPVHPRTRIQLDSLGLHKRMAEAGVIVTEPLRYLDFLCLEASALFVITDSGGVQEETTALGVPCFTIRRNTERPVTVELGTNTVLGADPERIVEIPHLLGTARRGGTVPFWDGKAGERAAGVLIEFLHRASP